VRARHPNIVNVRRFFRLHGTGYIVQNYEQGQTLGQRLSSGPIYEDELRRILDGVLSGLDRVHELTMLHRDIKPSNIILRDDGTPVLIDFGAARDFETRNTRSVTAMGTEGYSPPEQRGVGGQQGPWTDLYALGATAYHCVTGQPPADALRRLRKDILVPASVAAEGKYSPALLRAIDWMLKIDEAERPVSVAALREALQNGVIPADAATPADAVTPSVSSVMMKPGTPARKNSGLVITILAAATILLLLGGGYGAYTYNHQQRLAVEQQEAAERALTQDLAKAEIDKTALEADITACRPKCPADLESRAKARITQIEQARRAQQVAEQKLTEELARNDMEKSALEAAIAACGANCSSELKSRAAARVEQIDKVQKARQAAEQGSARGPSASATPPIQRDGGHASLGLHTVAISDRNAETLNVHPARGALVVGVDDQGSAKRSGIEAGDVIVGFDGNEVKGPSDLSKFVGAAPAGTIVTVIAIHRGEISNYLARLDRAEDENKETTTAAPVDVPTAQKVLGLNLATLSGDLRSRYNVKDGIKGVLITDVDVSAAVTTSQLVAGETIVEIAQAPVSSPIDAKKRFEQLKTDGKRSALLLISRPDGELRFVAMTLR
jgi:hypothetical protein